MNKFNNEKKKYATIKQRPKATKRKRNKPCSKAEPLWYGRAGFLMSRTWVMLGYAVVFWFSHFQRVAGAL